MTRSFRLTFFVATLIVLVSVLPVQNVPKLNVPLSDKIGHFVAYTGFALIFLYDYVRHFRWSKRLTRSLIVVAPICIGFGILMEFIQAIPFINRHFELLDMLANSIGVAIGSLVFSLVYIPLKKLHIK